MEEEEAPERQRGAAVILVQAVQAVGQMEIVVEILMTVVAVAVVMLVGRLP
jgi:hypothetical protein